MYTQVEKPKENKSRAISNSVVHKKSNVKQGFGFVDNRKTDRSSRIGNVSYNDPTQLVKITNGKTSIENHGQPFAYGMGKNVTVGRTMEAYLDPATPIRGWSANLNTSQDDMMAAMRNYHGIKGGDLVKGHLLNDNLGGTALNENLFPITRGANSSHLGFVENLAKQYAWQGTGLHYKLVVDGKADIGETSANFLTEISEWNPATNAKGPAKQINVESDLKKVRDYDAAYNPDDFSEHLSRENNPKKPGNIVTPAKRVGDLSAGEAAARNADI